MGRILLFTCWACVSACVLGSFVGGLVCGLPLCILAFGPDFVCSPSWDGGSHPGVRQGGNSVFNWNTGRVWSSKVMYAATKSRNHKAMINFIIFLVVFLVTSTVTVVASVWSLVPLPSFVFVFRCVPWQVTTLCVRSPGG